MLSQFRADFYACLTCLTCRPDALFELTDALLCTEGPVKTLVDLALAPEHRRVTELCTEGSTRDGSTSAGSAGLCPACRCRERRTAGWSWPSMYRPG